MANVNSVQHAAKTSQGGTASNLNAAWATYEIATALSADDTITMFTLPKGATVIGGWLTADDLDTNMTETIELDVGDASSATRFLNSGVLNGDAVTNVLPEGGIRIPLFGTLKDGPYTYTADTDIIVTVTAAAATGGTGTVSLTILYTYQDHRVTPPDAPV